MDPSASSPPSSPLLHVDFPELPGALLANLNQQRLQGQLCDLSIHVRGRVFRAHRAVLAASSPYFHDQVLLKNMSSVVLPSVMDPGAFETVLGSAYTGRLSMAPDAIVNFLTVGSVLQMWHIVDKCTELLKEGRALPGPPASAAASASRAQPADAQSPSSTNYCSPHHGAQTHKCSLSHPRGLCAQPGLVPHKQWVYVKQEWLQEDLVLTCEEDEDPVQGTDAAHEDEGAPSRAPGDEAIGTPLRVPGARRGAEGLSAPLRAPGGADGRVGGPKPKPPDAAHGAEGLSAPLRAPDAHGAPLRSPSALHGAEAIGAQPRSRDAVHGAEGLSAPLRAPDTHGLSAPLRSPDTHGAPLRSPDTHGAPLRSPDAHVLSTPLRSPPAVHGADGLSPPLRSPDAIGAPLEDQVNLCESSADFPPPYEGLDDAASSSSSSSFPSRPLLPLDMQGNPLVLLPAPHGAVQTSSVAGDGTKIFLCHCGKAFSHRSMRDRHVNMHLNLRPFACPVCAKRFKMKHHLTEHMKTHTGLKPYQCHVCAKRFMWRDSFVRHRGHCERRQGRGGAGAGTRAAAGKGDGGWGEG